MTTKINTKKDPERLIAFKAYKDGEINYAEYKSIRNKIHRRKKREIEEYGHILPDWQVKYTKLPNFKKLCNRNVPEFVYLYHAERYAKYTQTVEVKAMRKKHKDERRQEKLFKKYLGFIFDNYIDKKTLSQISQGKKPYINDFFEFVIYKEEEIKNKKRQEKMWRKRQFEKETACLSKQNNKLEMMALAVFSNIDNSINELKECL